RTVGAQRPDRGCVPNHGLDLQAVPNDRWILQQPLHAGRGEAGDLRRIERRERPAVPLTLVQDRGPGQTCLRTFEAEHLEEAALVVHWHTPFLVMVREVLGIVRRSPRAAEGPAGLSSRARRPG